MNEIRNEFKNKLNALDEIEFTGAKIPQTVYAYIDFLEKRIQALSMSGVVGRSESFFCECDLPAFIGNSLTQEILCVKCKKAAKK